MNDIFLKHIRTLPLEMVAAELAKDLSIEPLASSGYSYEAHGYIVRIEVVRPQKGESV